MNTKVREAAASDLDNDAIHRRLSSTQRSTALRIISAYRTVSTSAVLVVASVPPIDLLAEERLGAFLFRKEHVLAMSRKLLA